MRFWYYLYGVLATAFFIILIACITYLLGNFDLLYTAVSILFGTIIACTIYITDQIKDLKNDLHKISDLKQKQ